MKRYTYLIFSEGIKIASNPFVYNYSNTKNIELTIKKRGFCIRVCRGVKKDFERILDDKLFKDAIKKCCLIQLIKYGAFHYDALYANIDGDERILCDSSQPMVYGLCGNALHSEMSKNWQMQQFKRMLNTTKSKENRIDAALYALIVAKSKNYVTEKFIYLWMAMNGLYGYIAQCANQYMSESNKKKWIKKEYAQIKFATLFFNYDYSTPKKEDQEQLDKIIEIELSKMVVTENMILTKDDLEKIMNCAGRVLQCFNMSEKMSTEGLLTFYFPYKMRCKYFHSERALPLLCFVNEHPLPIINMLNQVLEKFLDNNLYMWMDEEIVKNKFDIRIKWIAEACKCDNNGNFIEFSSDNLGGII